MNRRRVRGVRPAADSNQLQIDWNASDRGEQPAVPSPPPETIGVPPEKPTAVPAASASEQSVPSFTSKVSRRRNGVIARLPGPKPLPASVAAGRFGHDEDGRPIRPDTDEIHEITVNQADKLIDMIDSLKSAPGRLVAANSLPDEFHSIIAAYAQDFGEHAARQLEAYARRQSSLDEADRADGGWHR